MNSLQKSGAAAIIGALLFFSAAAADVSLGIKGGLNLARLRDLGFDDHYMVMKPGIIMGVSLRIPVMNMFSIQPEALYSSKGYKEVITRTRYVHNFNYLEFPVLFKLNVTAGSVIPNVYIGPALAFLVDVSAYTATDDKRSNFPDYYTKSLKQISSAIDFGLAMGGGLNIAAGSGQVVIDIRYTLGFVTLDKEGHSSEKNGVLSFMGGYTFGIGGR